MRDKISLTLRLQVLRKQPMGAEKGPGGGNKEAKRGMGISSKHSSFSLANDTTLTP